MKKSYTWLWITFGILVLIGIIAGIFYATGVLNQAIGGYTSLSISNVVVDGTNKIRIYGTSQGAEQISINFKKEVLNQYLNKEGLEATKDITGSINYIEQTKSFNILKNRDENFIKLDYKPKSSGFLCNQANCEASKPSSNYILIGQGRTSGLVGTCICSYYYSIGTNSEFTGASTKSFKVLFNIGGKTGTLTDESRIINLGSGATVEWTGDLSNIKNLEAPNYAILFNDGKYQKLISSTAYPQIVSAMESYKSCTSINNINTNFLLSLTPVAIAFSGIPESTIKSCQATFNNKVDNSLSDKSISYLSSIQDRVKDSSLNFVADSLKFNMDVPTSFPTFIITLDAESVGIIELKGEPSIVSCVPDKTIKSGDTYTTSLQVKNIGKSSGSFYGKIECGDVTGTLNEKLLEAGETAKLTASLTGSNINEGIDYSNCVVTVTDRKSQKSDTCNFKIGVEYESGLICEPKKVYCVDDKTLRTCSDDGKSYSDKECAEICSNSQCTAKGVTPPPTSECKYTWYKLGLDGVFCSIGKFLEKLKLLFAILFGLVAGVLALSYSLKFTEGSKSTGLKIGLGIGSLLVFGLTVGILVWIFASQFLFLVILTIVLISLGIIRGIWSKVRRITG